MSHILVVTKDISYSNKPEGGVKELVIEVEAGVAIAAPCGQIKNEGDQVFIQCHDAFSQGSSHVLKGDPNITPPSTLLEGLSLAAGTRSEIIDGDTLVSTEDGPDEYGTVTTTLTFQLV
jgi:hypothetical protein